MTEDWVRRRELERAAWPLMVTVTSPVGLVTKFTMTPELPAVPKIA